MAIRILTLASTLFLAIPCGIAPAAEPPSFDELLKLYNELGLPLPPKDAKLVRCKSTRSETINGTTQETTYYSLAFQIKPADATKRGPLLLDGCLELRAWWLENDPQVVSPGLPAADGVKIRLSNALLIAAQFHSRGWTKLAQRILDISEKDTDDLPQKVMLQQAWSYWLGQISKPKIDRAPVAKHLSQIIKLDKKLDTKENRAAQVTGIGACAKQS